MTIRVAGRVVEGPGNPPLTVIPTKPLRLCAVPGCTERVVSGKCAQHATDHGKRYFKAYNTERRDPDDPRRLARWRKVRAAYLNEHALCEDCGQWLADSVDHVTPLARGGDPFDWNNLRAMCSGCHALKTASERVAVGGSNSRTRPPIAAQCSDARTVTMARGEPDGR